MDRLLVFKRAILIGCFFTILSPLLSYAQEVSEVEHFMRLGLEGQKSGNMDKAERFYYRAMMASPEMEEPYLRLSDLYIAKGDFDSAMGILSRGEEQNGEAPAFWVRRGLIYRRLGEFDNAAAAYDKAVDMDADSVEILQRAAGFYQLVGDVTKAESLSQMAQSKM